MTSKKKESTVQCEEAGFSFYIEKQELLWIIVFAETLWWKNQANIFEEKLRSC